MPAMVSYSFVLAIFCVVAMHRKARASSELQVVDQETRSSLEAVLKVRSNFRMEGEGPLKMRVDQKNALRKTHPKIEMLEDTLRMVYHELFDASLGNITNSADGVSRYRSLPLSSRQSFFSEGLGSLSEYLMRMLERSLNELPSLPRLEAQECVKRSVCEAHNQPKKYGLIGLILQLLFPPYTKSEDPQNVVSKYQLAARYGRQSNANCGVQYDGCMLNLLDIVQALVNAFIK